MRQELALGPIPAAGNSAKKLCFRSQSFSPSLTLSLSLSLSLSLFLRRQSQGKLPRAFKTNSPSVPKHRATADGLVIAYHSPGERHFPKNRRRVKFGHGFNLFSGDNVEMARFSQKIDSNVNTSTILFLTFLWPHFIANKQRRVLTTLSVAFLSWIVSDHNSIIIYDPGDPTRILNFLRRRRLSQDSNKPGYIVHRPPLLEIIEIPMVFTAMSV
jgi:hypothetical protein